MLCCKKKDEIPEYTIRFLTLCYEGATADQLEKLFQKALENKAENQIFEAKDFDGNLPYYKAATFGQSEVLKWILETWSKYKQNLDLNIVSSKGLTALMSCCFSGF